MHTTDDDGREIFQDDPYGEQELPRLTLWWDANQGCWRWKVHAARPGPRAAITTVVFLGEVPLAHGDSERAVVGAFAEAFDTWRHLAGLTASSGFPERHQLPSRQVLADLAGEIRSREIVDDVAERVVEIANLRDPHTEREDVELPGAAVAEITGMLAEALDGIDLYEPPGLHAACVAYERRLEQSASMTPADLQGLISLLLQLGRQDQILPGARSTARFWADRLAEPAGGTIT